MKVIIVALGVLLAACGPRNNFNCEMSESCDLANGGSCVASPAGNMWCAYPDAECPSGYRYSTSDVGEGLAGSCVEATTDAGVNDADLDAAPDPAFTVVYGDDWRIAYDIEHRGWFVLVANGTEAPDLSTIQVVSVSDTHPVALVRILAYPTTGTVTPGKAAGSTMGDTDVLMNAAISEPRERTSEGYLSIQVLDMPFDEEFTFDAHVEVSVNGIQFPLDLRIFHPVTPTTYCQPETVRRKPIYR